jgi:hypothetical protein
VTQAAYNGAVEKTLQTLGLDVLLRPKAFCSGLMDFAVGCDHMRDIQVLQTNASESMMRILHDASSADVAEMRLARGKVRMKLVEECLLADAVADRLSFALADGVCRVAFGMDLDGKAQNKPKSKPKAADRKKPDDARNPAAESGGKDVSEQKRTPQAAETPKTPSGQGGTRLHDISKYKRSNNVTWKGVPIKSVADMPQPAGDQASNPNARKYKRSGAGR